MEYPLINIGLDSGLVKPESSLTVKAIIDPLSNGRRGLGLLRPISCGDDPPKDRIPFPFTNQILENEDPFTY